MTDNSKEYYHSQYSLTSNELAELCNITRQGLIKNLKDNEYYTYTFQKHTRIPSSEVRKFLKNRKFSYDNKKIAFQIIKGGTGKSTLCHEIAIRANQYGARVLGIDLDQQAHLSLAFGIAGNDYPVWFDVISKKVQIKEALFNITPNLDILPSNLNNSYLEKHIITNTKLNLKDLVSRYLKKVENDYDLILMDCPPALSTSNTAVACASDLIIIPVIPDEFAFDGLNKTLKELKEISTEFGTKYNCKAVLNMHDKREGDSDDFLRLLYTDYEDMTFSCFVSKNVELKKAIRQKRSIFHSIKKSSQNIRDDIDIVTRSILGFRK